MVELILALDLPARDEALRLLDRLPGLRWVKVGSVLMTAEGPPLVRELVGRGLRVFLDLKWHDIPNTVAGAVAAARTLGVHLATVHIAGGDAMMRAAAQSAGGALPVVGVTVLTSQGTAADFPERSPRSPHPSEESVDAVVVDRSRAGIRAGLAGVVCSPLEIERVRQAIGPNPLIVVPGIRRAPDARGDQARVAGPAEAVRWGATHLVVGRPILEAKDPTRTLDEFLSAIG
jgi:orotidine-5'-phosphate decarboxylase